MILKSFCGFHVHEYSDNTFFFYRNNKKTKNAHWFKYFLYIKFVQLHK